MTDPQWRNGGPPARPPAGRRPTPGYLTVAEVATVLRVSKMTVYRLVHGGEMAAVRIGRSFRVPFTELPAYVARNDTSRGTDR